jgi:DNA-binding PadR family transcriptional regulator
MRHGDVRVALLLALSEGPAHGYELGQRLLRASNGAWQPSPGSIYPTLQSLADEDLVSSDEQGQKRIYTLTPNGATFLKERSARGEALPWQNAQDGRSGELREAVHGLKLAATQVATAGTPAAVRTPTQRGRIVIPRQRVDHAHLENRRSALYRMSP